MAQQLSTPHQTQPTTIRDVRRDDVKQLVDLINALNLHEGTQESMTIQHAEYILFSPQRPIELLCKVAISRERIVGFILFYRGYDTASTSFGIHIADLFVEKSYRKCGVGTMLMRCVAQICLDMGAKWCSLTSARNNAAAKAFYDACQCFAQPVEFRAMGESGLRALLPMRHQ